jgi:Short C-terminal domain
MPGLLRGMARTAVVAGTATAVSNRVSRRQANRWAAQSQQQGYQQGGYYEEQAPAYEAPPPAPADDMDAKLAQLRELGELKSQGVLSEEEFAAQKRRILGS